MLNWLKSIDWRDIVGAALLTIFLMAVFEPSLTPPQQQNSNTNANNETSKQEQLETFWWWLTTDPIESFTGILALFTGLLAFVSYKQVTLANAEFISTHRPQLRVRKLKAHLTNERPVRVSYVVVNIGATPAHIKRIEGTFGIYKVPTGGTARELQADAEPQKILTIKAGDSWLFIAAASDLEYDEEWGIAPYIGGWLEFRGMIEYSDDNGVDRQTSFWRILDPNTGRFHAKDDPDYEFED